MLLISLFPNSSNSWLLLFSKFLIIVAVFKISYGQEIEEGKGEQSFQAVKNQKHGSHKLWL